MSPDTILAGWIRGALPRGCHVATAYDWCEAMVRLASDEAFECLVCDLGASPVSAAAVSEMLAHRHPLLVGRVVFVTGDACDEDLAFLQRASSVSIENPFDLGELREAIDTVVPTRI